MNKYNVGDVVHCFRGTPYVTSFDFTGEILSLADTGEGWEYEVKNAPMTLFGPPCLIWESEITTKITSRKVGT